MKWGDANYGLDKRARDGGYWGVADNLLVLPTRFAVTAVHVEFVDPLKRFHARRAAQHTLSWLHVIRSVRLA